MLVRFYIYSSIIGNHFILLRVAVDTGQKEGDFTPGTNTSPLRGLRDTYSHPHLQLGAI